jgi:hypothetical protein
VAHHRSRRLPGHLIQSGHGAHRDVCRGFTQGLIITNGGPNNATLLFVLYLYREAFQNGLFGYGAAMSWVMFALLLTATLAILASLGAMSITNTGALMSEHDRAMLRAVDRLVAPSAIIQRQERTL